MQARSKERKEQETALKTPRSRKKEGDEVLQVLEQIGLQPMKGHARAHAHTAATGTPQSSRWRRSGGTTTCGEPTLEQIFLSAREEDPYCSSLWRTAACGKDPHGSRGKVRGGGSGREELTTTPGYQVGKKGVKLNLRKGGGGGRHSSFVSFSPSK